MSSRYQERIRALEHQINLNRHESRAKLTKLTNEYNYQVTMKKKQWLQEKKKFDMTQAKSVFPTTFRQNPVGTQATANFRRLGGIANLIGTCMADIVDATTMITEGNAMRPQKFPPFKPPPAPPSLSPGSGESLAQKATRLDEQLRHQHQECVNRLKQSEEERKRAWKKMVKTKAEFEMQPIQQGRRGARFDPSNYVVQMPGLGGGPTKAASPQPVAAPRPRAPAFSTASPGVSQSKYSAARVRARISQDGCVAPVSEPKKTKDGLYQRPAGRTRKGMQWDAVRGIWAPE